MRRKSLAELKKKKVDLWKLTGRFKSPREKVVGEIRPLKRGDVDRINRTVDRILEAGGDKIETILLVGGGARYLRGKRREESLRKGDHPESEKYGDIDIRVIIKNRKDWGEIWKKVNLPELFRKERIDINVAFGYKKEVDKYIDRGILLHLKALLQGNVIPIYNKEAARKLLEKIEKDLKKKR